MSSRGLIQTGENCAWIIYLEMAMQFYYLGGIIS